MLDPATMIHIQSFGCPWFCTAEDGPSAPFTTPFLLIADSVRLFCILCGMVVVLYVPTALNCVRSRTRRMQLYGLALFMIVAITTEAEHIGDQPNYRLVLNLIGCICTVYGLVTYRQRIRAHAA
jgi:peptidoglycan/LPS O-acetylase OafA/YrhL